MADVVDGNMHNMEETAKGYGVHYENVKNYQAMPDSPKRHVQKSRRKNDYVAVPTCTGSNRKKEDSDSSSQSDKDIYVNINSPLAAKVEDVSTQDSKNDGEPTYANFDQIKLENENKKSHDGKLSQRERISKESGYGSMREREDSITAAVKTPASLTESSTSSTTDPYYQNYKFTKEVTVRGKTEEPRQQIELREKVLRNRRKASKDSSYEDYETPVGRENLAYQDERESQIYLTPSDIPSRLQENIHHRSEFTVSKEGGCFTNKDLCMMVPCDAVNESTEISMTELSDVDKLLATTNNKVELNTKLYELEPHGEKFGNFLTLRFPMQKRPKTSSQIMLLYSNSKRQEPAEWVYFSKKMSSQTGKRKEDLPSISWMIMNNFCVVMIDRFCLLGVGESEEQEDEIEFGSRSVNVSCQEDDAGEDGPQVNRDLQRNRDVGQQRSPGTRFVNVMIHAKLKSSNQISMGIECSLGDEEVDKLEADAQQKNKRLLKIPLSKELAIPSNWKSTVFTSFASSEDSNSFELKNLNGSFFEMPLHDESENPKCTFRLEEKSGLYGDGDCNINIRFEKHEEKNRPEQSGGCFSCFGKRPAVDEPEVLDMTFTLEKDMVSKYKTELRKRNTYIPKDKMEVLQTEVNGKVYDDVQEEVQASNSRKDYRVSFKDPSKLLDFKVCGCFCQTLQIDLQNSLLGTENTVLEAIAEDMGVKEDEHFEINPLMLIQAIIMTNTNNLYNFKRLLAVLRQRSQHNAHEILKCEIQREQLRIIQKCAVQQMRPEGIIAKMFSNKLLKPQDKEFMSSMSSSEEKSEYLLREHVLKLDRSNFMKFLDVLHETDHMDIANRIENVEYH